MSDDQLALPVPALSAPTPIMTTAELRDVTMRLITASEREPSEALIRLWAEQAGFGRWTYAEAVGALNRWRTGHPPGEFLEPATIGQMIRTERQDAAMQASAAEARQRVAEVEAARERDRAHRPTSFTGEPATEEFRRQTLAGIAADRGWNITAEGVSDPDLRETALPIACRWCQAPPGQFCHVLSKPDQRLSKRGAHPCRVEDLRALQAAGSPS